MTMLRIFKNSYFWLLIILLLALTVRLYKVTSPIADWHSWRQADTATVTRNFVKEGFNPFLPRGDDMSGVADTPLVNTLRLRFVEFPIYNIAVYPVYLLFGINDSYHRLVSVFFSLGSLLFVFSITKHYLGKLTALLAAMCFGLLPFNVFFSRTTLPEPTFVFFALGMVYFVDRWIWSTSRRMRSWGFIFTVIAFLMKPWAIFFVPPLFYSIVKKERNILPPLKYILFFLLALTPFILWRLWILQQPEGIPASGWLLNGDGIRFRPAFWRWIISERLGGEILGVTGLFLFLIGLITKPKDGKYFLHVWALSMFLYFLVFATGNVRHNYYQVLFVPVGSIFLAKGFLDLFRGGINFVPRIWTILLALLFLPLSFYLSWNEVKGLYQINNPAIVEAGKKADQIIPKEAIVLAPYNGDTAFLYQTNRAGWPVTALPVLELVADYGVTHFVSTSRDDKTNWVIRHFRVLEDNPRFVIADLTKINIRLDGDLEP